MRLNFLSLDLKLWVLESSHSVKVFYLFIPLETPSWLLSTHIILCFDFDIHLCSDYALISFDLYMVPFTAIVSIQSTSEMVHGPDTIPFNIQVISGSVAIPSSAICILDFVLDYGSIYMHAPHAYKRLLFQRSPFRDNLFRFLNIRAIVSLMIMGFIPFEAMAFCFLLGCAPIFKYFIIM